MRSIRRCAIAVASVADTPGCRLSALGCSSDSNSDRKIEVNCTVPQTGENGLGV